MEINVTKMHGLGNDFALVDGLSSGISLTPEQIMRIADRRLGVGCDQVLLESGLGVRGRCQLPDL